MADLYNAFGPDITSPPAYAVAVTPGLPELAFVSRALYVGGAGDLHVTTLGGSDVVFTGIPAGTLLPLRVTHVLASSTTATGIVALW